jgi:hypothetical protein
MHHHVDCIQRYSSPLGKQNNNKSSIQKFDEKISNRRQFENPDYLLIFSRILNEFLVIELNQV